MSAAIEALLLLATQPVSETSLAEAIGVSQEEIAAECERLAAWYQETGRGFVLRRVGGGWRYYTHPDHHELIETWVRDNASTKLSVAAKETLAVIAYFQPITRSRISSIRGVNVDSVVRTLVSRGLVESIDPDKDTGAARFVTTPVFCERMGLNSLDELPKLAPHLLDAVELEAELAQLSTTEGE